MDATGSSLQAQTRPSPSQIVVPHLLIARSSSERPISQLNELTVNLLKVVAVSAIILGFIFDLPKVMFFGLAVGVLAFALHFVARSVPNESFVAEVLSFFWSSSTRQNSPTTPPAAPSRRTGLGVVSHARFHPTLPSVEQSPNLTPHDQGLPLSIIPLGASNTAAHPSNKRGLSRSKSDTTVAFAQRRLIFDSSASIESGDGA